MEVTIFGAGAIGGTVGAFMTRAGHDVTVVDIVQEHVDIVDQRGLLITGIRGEHRYPLRAVHADARSGPLRHVFLAVKAHFTERVVQEQIAPFLAEDGFVVSLQNGLNEDTIARIVGHRRTVGAFVHFGADYLEPGHIQLGQEQDIYLGELDGSITDRLYDLQAALSSVMPVHLTDNIYGFLWGKLVYASMAFAVSTVDAPVPEVLSDRRGQSIARAASCETAAVAGALGYDVQPIGRFDPRAFLRGPGVQQRADQALGEFRREMEGSVKQHMGIWRDLKIKKRKTEVDAQLGPVIQQAAAVGIDVPVNRAIVDLIHEIEDGKRGMEWSNLNVLASAVSVP